MVDPTLLAYLESPIASAERANRVFLPEGRRPVTRQKAEPLTPEQRKARKRDKELAKEYYERRQREASNGLLDYYAGTDLPIERIAANLGVSVDAATQMIAERRGKKA